MISSSICFPANDRILFFFMAELYSNACIYHIFLRSIHQFWAPRLLPKLGYCEQRCNKRGRAGVSLPYWFTPLRRHAQERDGRLTGFGFLMTSILISTGGCTGLRSHQHCTRLFSCILTGISCWLFSWWQPCWLGWGGVLVVLDLHFLYR
jgi:hypothetical protein